AVAAAVPIIVSVATTDASPKRPVYAEAAPFLSLPLPSTLDKPSMRTSGRSSGFIGARNPHAVTTPACPVPRVRDGGAGRPVRVARLGTVGDNSRRPRCPESGPGRLGTVGDTWMSPTVQCGQPRGVVPGRRRGGRVGWRPVAPRRVSA